MEEKSYSEMKKEFMLFYHNEVKYKLPEYEKMRKKESLKLFLFSLTWFSILFLFTLFISNFIIPVLIIISGLLHIPFVMILSVGILLLAKKIVVFILPIPFISIFCLVFLTRGERKYSNGAIRIQIKSDFEMELKKPLMSKFLNIFLSNSQWMKGFHKNQNSYTTYELKNISEKIKQIRAQKFLNPFLWLNFDDVILGNFKNVKLNIYESDTRIFNRATMYVIPFLLIWATLATGGLILFVGVLFAVVFAYKIYQYAPFRGLIVEIEMNKNFTGHTFFHEKSFAARKIPFNKKIYTPVALEKSGFADKYQVFSDNQIEARYLLTTAMMERIENLSFAFKAKSVRGSFKDNKLMLAINTGKDMLAMGDDFKQSNTDTFVHLYDEMISILQIIDELKLNEHTGL